MSTRAAPFHCPFCGEEDLRPDADGGWLCADCRRVFSVTLHGLNLPEGTG